MAKLLMLTMGGPVSNLVLASGGIIVVLLILREIIEIDLLLIGAAIFGYYFVGLSAIYLVMSRVLRLIGIARIFQAAVALEGIAFALCLAAYVA
jgi:hypothetical protein